MKYKNWRCFATLAAILMLGQPLLAVQADAAAAVNVTKVAVPTNGNAAWHFEVWRWTTASSGNETDPHQVLGNAKQFELDGSNSGNIVPTNSNAPFNPGNEAFLGNRISFNIGQNNNGTYSIVEVNSIGQVQDPYFETLIACAINNGSTVSVRGGLEDGPVIGPAMDLSGQGNTLDCTVTNFRKAFIRAIKFQDQDMNGIQDGADGYLGGWQYRLYNLGSNGTDGADVTQYLTVFPDTGTRPASGAQDLIFNGPPNDPSYILCEEPIPGANRDGWAFTGATTANNIALNPGQYVIPGAAPAGSHCVMVDAPHWGESLSDPGSVQYRKFGNAAVASLTIKKVNVTADEAYRDWDFSVTPAVPNVTQPVNLNGSNDGANNVRSLVVPVGSYAVIESAGGGGAQFFDLTGMSCVDDNTQAGVGTVNQAGDGIENIDLTVPGASVTCTFDNQRRAYIQAHKFHDVDFDGVQNNGETNLSGWAFKLYEDNNGQPGNEFTDVTLSAGAGGTTVASGNMYFWFNGTPTTANYWVCETIQPSWDSTGGTVDGGAVVAPLENGNERCFLVENFDASQYGTRTTVAVGNAETAQLRLVKTATPDSAASWTFDVAGPSTENISLDGGNSGVEGKNVQTLTVFAGTYSIAESGGSSVYALTGAECVDDNGANNAPAALVNYDFDVNANPQLSNLVLAAGAVVTCNFTNERLARVVIRKFSDFSTPGQSTNFNAIYNSGAGEVSLGDWAFGLYQDNAGVPGVPVPAADVVLAPANGKTRAGNPGLGTMSIYSREAGDFWLCETRKPDWEVSGVNSGTPQVEIPNVVDTGALSCVAITFGSDGSYVYGESQTYRFGNVEMAKLTVVKHTGSVNNSNIHWQFNVDGRSSGNFTLDGANGANATHQLTVSAGSYSITESNGPPQFDLTGVDCVNDNDAQNPPAFTNNNNQVSALEIVPGASITCTFTNERKPVIRVAKYNDTGYNFVDALDGDDALVYGWEITVTPGINGQAADVRTTNANNSGYLWYGNRDLNTEYEVCETIPATGFWSPQGVLINDALTAFDAPAPAVPPSPGDKFCVTIDSGDYGNVTKIEFVNARYGQVIVNKVADPDNNHDFQFSHDFAGLNGLVPASFTLTGTDSATFNWVKLLYGQIFTPYTVTEDITAGNWWSLLSAPGCVASSSGNGPLPLLLDPQPDSADVVINEINDIATCTFTNVREPRINVFKFRDLDNNGVADGGEPALAGWTFNVYRLTENGGTPLAVPEGPVTKVTEDGANNPNRLGKAFFGNLQWQETYRVCEVLQPGWDVSGATVDGVASVPYSNAAERCVDVTTGVRPDPNGNPPVVGDPGQVIRINMGNAPYAKLTVVKSLNPVDAASQWAFAVENTAGAIYPGFNLNGGNAAPSDRHTLEVVPGTYTITETVNNYHDLTGAVCTDDIGGGPVSFVADYANGNISGLALAPGDEVTCTFTNERWARIRARVFNDYNGLDSTTNFDGIINNSETGLSGRQLHLYGDASGAPDTVNPLSVATVSIPNNGQTNSNGTIQIYFSNMPGGPIAGDYWLCETVPAGWKFTKANRVNNSAGVIAEAPLAGGANELCFKVAITGAYGQEEVLRFGNAQTAKLTLTKVTDPAVVTSPVVQWPFNLGGPDPDMPNTVTLDTVAATPETETVSYDVLPGTYTLEETAVADAWDFTESTCTNAIVTVGPGTDNPISAPLEPQQEWTCTFTNRRKPVIQVFKFDDRDYDFETAQALDGNEVPVEGWRVEVTPEGGAVETETTDAQGAAWFGNRNFDTTYSVCEVMPVAGFWWPEGAWVIQPDNSSAYVAVTPAPSSDPGNTNFPAPGKKYCVSVTTAASPEGYADLTAVQFVNARYGKVIVNKTAVPDNQNHAFDFTHTFDGIGYDNSNGPQDFSMNGTDSETFFWVKFGEYTITESIELSNWWSLVSAPGCTYRSSPDAAPLILDPQPNQVAVTLPNEQGEDIAECSFTNVREPRINVFKYYDHDESGTLAGDASEEGLGGWTFNFYRLSDGTGSGAFMTDPVLEKTKVTNDGVVDPAKLGKANVGNLQWQETYRVCEELVQGWSVTDATVQTGNGPVSDADVYINPLNPNERCVDVTTGQMPTPGGDGTDGDAGEVIHINMGNVENSTLIIAKVTDNDPGTYPPSDFLPPLSVFTFDSTELPPAPFNVDLEQIQQVDDLDPTVEVNVLETVSTSWAMADVACEAVDGNGDPVALDNFMVDVATGTFSVDMPPAVTATCTVTNHFNDGDAQDGEGDVPNKWDDGTGDGNGDGIPDLWQRHVSSIEGLVGDCWFTVENTEGYQNHDVFVHAIPTRDPDWILPCGGVGYEITIPDNAPNGMLHIVINVTMDAFASEQVEAILKRNRLTGVYESVAMPVFEGNKVVFRFTAEDNDQYDDDLAARNYKDPSDPAYHRITPVPTLQWGALVLLIAVLGLMGAVRSRRHH